MIYTNSDPELWISQKRLRDLVIFCRVSPWKWKSITWQFVVWLEHLQRICIYLVWKSVKRDSRFDFKHASTFKPDWNLLTEIRLLFSNMRQLSNLIENLLKVIHVRISNMHQVSNLIRNLLTEIRLLISNFHPVSTLVRNLLTEFHLLIFKYA